ncbi:hypothetical protein MAPG_02727 [Magnaporthiopsis poae ATCC 64411]|uniref:YoqW n=1 Tax=Magnaporthiopsis poae (strain ATCC 64411 / 73-15) TaxID=644358 RepID=A0A0C4DS52_MAGP6|nr:hypothetical protein MAPG_02727 [Magnaporthiopsis poae ATCC 64411]
MCGRYALALRPSQIRQLLEDDDMPVWDAPPDPNDGADDEDGGGGGGGGSGGGGGEDASSPQQQQPRQSYNFAPGYNGIVYRADVPDFGAGPHRGHGEDGSNKPAAASPARKGSEAASGGEVRYKLQAMKWGLIPFWTKHNPNYAGLLKTINCRDDSLAAGGGMWSTMKARKRCIVVAQGFYEWLKVGKERVPYYTRRKDGKLLCMAGLWDCVQYEGDQHKTYTYSIITTDSNKQLKFLHDRMPVILEPGSEDLRTWLDPARFEWSAELQSLLRPFAGELEVYAVSKDVNKAGGVSSPSFIIPVASRENKSNIANFFASAPSPVKEKKELQLQPKHDGGVAAAAAAQGVSAPEEETKPAETDAAAKDKEKPAKPSGPKRPAELGPINSDEQPPAKKQATPASSKTISATKNSIKSPNKSKPKASAGTQKITKFFAAK